MPKPPRKSKGPKGPNGGQNFNEDTLTQLTSKIDKNLTGAKANKRKTPPTGAGKGQNDKRQRNLAGGAASSAPKDDQEALLKEILALGGDEDDLDLINGVDSDDDTQAQPSNGPVDKKLKEELLALSKELGFADIQVGEASDDDAQDDGSEDETDTSNDMQEDDESDEEEEVKPRKMGDMVWQGSSFSFVPGF